MALETTLELVQYIENQTNELSDGTSPFRSTAVGLLNRAHKAIIAGGIELDTMGRGPVIFHWAKSQFPKTIILLPAEEGTVSVSQDSSTLTFDSAPSTNLLNYFIRINNTNEVYRISAHSGTSTSATLDTTYVGDDVTSEDFTAFKLIYDCTDILALAGEIQTFRKNQAEDDEIPIVDKVTMDNAFPLTYVEECAPKMAGILKLDTDGVLTLQFNSYPNKRERVQFEYVPIPDDLAVGGNDPILPKHHRLLVAELALYYYQVGLDDDRASTHLQRAKEMFESLVRENDHFQELGNDNFGRIFPFESDRESTQYRRSQSGYYIGIYE